MASCASSVARSRGQCEKDYTELQCIVCEESFSDVIVPRNLGCGHTLCTSCIEYFFLKDIDKTCPECRKPFSARSATDLPVNYPLLRLSRSAPSPDSVAKGSGRTNIKWDNRVAIEDHGAGPVWRPSPFDFMCKISMPKKQSEFLGMKNYIAYTVTPSFSSKHVLRRYKQFDMIHDQLRTMFPQIVLPKLPEKQLLGNFNEDLIEYRTRSLQSWIDRICRHPILSQCDIFRLFITVSNEKTWKPDIRRMKTENQLLQNFFSGVKIPESFFDLALMENKLDSYVYFVNELEKAIKEILQASLSIAEKYQMHYLREKDEISQSFMKLAQAFSIATCEAPELPALVFHISEAYSSMAKLSTQETEQAWQALFNLMTEYHQLIEELQKTLAVAKRTITKAYQLELSDYQHAAVASNVFLAEVAHFTQSLVADIRNVIKDILQQELNFYQTITHHLRNMYDEITGEEKVNIPSLRMEPTTSLMSTSDEFMIDGKVEPTAPPMELLE